MSDCYLTPKQAMRHIYAIMAYCEMQDIYNREDGLYVRYRHINHRSQFGYDDYYIIYNSNSPIVKSVRRVMIRDNGHFTYMYEVDYDQRLQKPNYPTTLN